VLKCGIKGRDTDKEGNDARIVPAYVLTRMLLSRVLWYNYVSKEAASCLRDLVLGTGFSPPPSRKLSLQR